LPVVLTHQRPSGKAQMLPAPLSTTCALKRLAIASAAASRFSFTSAVVDLRYKDLNIPPAQQEIMNGNKPNDWRTPLQYRARPLNGIWATPPYLHNGSVPNLYQVLLPPEQRSKLFYVGNREFDPRNVGFEFGFAPGAFKLDTSISGNSNQGHTYGTNLSDAERWDLVEYLKSL